MIKFESGASALVALLLYSVAALAGSTHCAKTSDVQGRGVCSNDTGVKPRVLAQPSAPLSGQPTAQRILSADASPAPSYHQAPYAHSEPPRLEPAPAWPKGYATVSAMLGFHTWGSILGVALFGPPSPTADLSAGASGGIHVAGYYAFSRVFHLGVYFGVMGSSGTLGAGQTSRPLLRSDSAVESVVRNYSVGTSLKVGSTAGRRLWIGGAMDVGYAALEVARLSATWHGLVFSPRFEIDFLILGDGRFKMIAFGAVGVQVSPDTLWMPGSGSAPTYGTWAWVVQPTMLLGVSFGR